MPLSAGIGSVRWERAADLGTGQPMEHGLRTRLRATVRRKDLWLDADTRRCVFCIARLVEIAGAGPGDPAR